MEARGYREGDLEKLGRKFDLVAPDDDVAEWAALNSRSWTIEHEGIPVGIFGVYQVYEGVLQGWGMVSEMPRQFAIAFYRRCKRLLREATKKALRVNVQVDASNKQNLRFALLMGFQIEFLPLPKFH